jgi:hypothetical protein
MCGWCGRLVAACNGWFGEDDEWIRRGGTGARWVYIAMCPNCRTPTCLNGDRQYPGVKTGEEVEHLPPDVAALYAEARSAAGYGIYTGAVLLGRKLLMHVAVEKGADENKKFAYYVGWLVDNGVVTADMKDWVDEIRELGNDANHEIILMARDEAEALLTFLSMLLKIVYEYPERGRRSVAARAGRVAADKVVAADEQVEPDADDDPPPAPRVLGGT